MHNQETFFNGIVVLHGQSGAGKGELQKRLVKQGLENNIRIIYLSSGDLFRAANSREIAKSMEGGKQIPSLEKIAPLISESLESYMVAKLKGEKVMIILDGVLRNGEDLTPEGQRIPSQVTQLAEMFARAGKDLIKEHPGLVQVGMANHRIDPEMLKKFFYHQTTDCGQVVEEGFLAEIAESIRHDVNHAVVDVTAEDAEILMRFRSAKTIEENLIPAVLAKKESGNAEKVQHTVDNLSELLKIQTGRFSMEGAEITTLDIDSPSRSFIPFSTVDDDVVAIDGKIKDVCLELLGDLGVNDIPESASPVALALTKIKEEFGLPSDVMPRADDILLTSRISRNSEYRQKVQPNLLEGELGIGLSYNNASGEPVELDLSDTRATPEKVSLIVNGPDRGIPFQRLVEQADETSKKIMRDAVPSGVESVYSRKER